ncbi:MAG: hypothetical protein ABEJ86_06425 [Halococcoides sp.]
MRPRVAVVGICLLAVVVAPAVGAATSDGTNTTDWNGTHHVPPDAAGDSADRGVLSQRLLASMRAQLANSSAALERGDFEAAKATLGNDFRRDLRRYRSLVDNATVARALNRTRIDQRRLAETGQRLRKATRAYRRAQKHGNETAAQRSLRRIQRLNRTLATQHAAVRSDYQALDRTGVETDRAADRLDRAADTATERIGSVLDRVVRQTHLSVVAADRRASPTDPLDAAVRLRGPAGPVPPGSGTFRLDGRPVEVRDWNGSIVDLRYRPLWARTGDRNRTLTFRPDPGTRYGRSAATLSVEIRSAAPTIALGDPGTATYRDPVTVPATVTVAGGPVGNATLRMRVDGRVVATATTAANGSATLSGRLPAGIDPGDHELRVAMMTAGRALAPGTATATLAVERTPTRIVAHRNGTRIRGRLVTADGRALPDRRLALSGAIDRTVKTDARGQFSVAIGTASGSVTVAFEPAVATLGPNRTTLSLGSTGGALPPLTPRDWWLPAVAFVGIIIIFGAVWVRSRDRSPSTGVASGDTTPDGGAVAPHALPGLYRTARDAVPGGNPALTPRETARRARSELSDRRAAVVAAIARAYEREVYALDPADRSAVRAHRRALRWLLGR